MKKQILMLAFSLLATVFLYAQTTPEFKCGTMEYLQMQKDADPTLESRMLLQEKQLQQWIKDNYNPNSKTVITIPVVVHIVYNAPEQNVSDQRVFEQIAMSNRDFAGLNPHSMGAFSLLLKANTGIQFCLAQKAPNGSSTTGIERRFSPVDTFYNNNVKYYSTGGLDAWDPTKYLNIWVCNMYHVSGDYRLAYGQFPTSGVNETYGVAVTYYYFGRSGFQSTMNNGGITTHEIGHCLNLRHIWADDNGACTGTDYCGDTPNQADPTSGLNSGVVTDACSPTSPGIMYMNFMDYSQDSSYANFTPDQTARIMALFASNGLLLSLANSDACSLPSLCETPTSLKVTSITGKNAVLGWTAMVNALSYNIRYRKVGTTKWISTTSISNSKPISGLKSNTTYEFQVQTVCTSGSSSFSSSMIFKATNAKASEITVIEEFNNSTELIIFPNPAKEQATIHYFIENGKNIEVKLIDITGRIIKSERFTAIQDENNYTLDLNMVNKGLYFVEFNIIGQEKLIRKLFVE